jgi:DNA phosphorothioation-dependent restriction protein DptH
MGTYQAGKSDEASELIPEEPVSPRVTNLLQRLDVGKKNREQLDGILVGADAESAADIFWTPDPASGSVNPHVLIVGESGFGKTYAIMCLLTELARKGFPSVIFDYGQGFSLDAAPAGFLRQARPVEINASGDGVAINPLQLFPSDVLGPVNVAQRLADTFQRVYAQIGVQQHALLRQAVLDVFRDAGIIAEAADSWSRRIPAFADLQSKLAAFAADPLNAQRRIAASVASHISTLFVFNTFRANGKELDWRRMVRLDAPPIILQLKGLETSLERAVTELLLWNLIGFVESLGPGPLRCFIVLDEAHKLAFSPGCPAEKLLREGRKFGLAVILASQQPDDFSPVAFANTATKLIFQVSDERSTVSRQIAKKVGESHSVAEISQLITRLPRGCAYFLTENVGRVVRILPFSDRVLRWAN